MAATTQIGLRRLTPAVGAIITGMKLHSPMDAKAIDFVRDALSNHGVIFFQDQDVSVDQLWAFLTNFGTPQKEDSFGTDADRPDDIKDSDLFPTRKGTAVWHADSTFLASPPKITLLRSVKLPPCGGDTLWASMVAAYEALSGPLRTMIDGLTAVHAIERAVAPLGQYGDAFIDKFTAIHAPHQVHPMVQMHPESGRKALFVTESCTTRIVEFGPAESRHMLGMLFEHIKSPDFGMRWHWEPNDVAMWDNRIVQHYAVPDYDGARVMQRIVVAGDRPCGAGRRDHSKRESRASS